jgi:hypothetical protein
MHRRSAAFRLLPISRRQSARTCASTDKLATAGNGFGLLQHQKVSRTRQVDNPDTLAELLAERVAIARRSRYIIEPLYHEKRGCSGTPPPFERHTSAAREVGEMHRRPAYYRHRRPNDEGLRERLKELAAQRRRFGYRRLWVLLRCEGYAVNRKGCTGSIGRSG